MELNFLNLCQTAWREVLNHLQDAAVFIDSKAGECLHWSIGSENILLEGALAIKELNAYKYSQEPIDNAEKAVFLTASSYATIQVDLCDIISQSSFHSITLVTAPLPEPQLAIPKIKHDLLQWMSMKNRNLQNLHADVLLFPAFFAPIIENTIMLPPFRDLFPSLDLSKVKSFGSKPEVISLKDLATAQSLAVFLDSLFNQMGAADVVFSIGSLSGAVASALEDLPSVHHRRKMGQHRLSVVIVDRTLDLCLPSSVDSKCFLDKVLCALPHIPDQTNDVAVNMSQLAQVTVDSPNDEALFPGCLAHQDSVCQNVIEWFIHKKDRDILINLHQILLSKLSPGNKFATRVKPEALEKDVRQFRGNLEKIEQNCGILQIALAVVQTLTGEHAEELELILSTERVLRQNVTTSAETCELAGLLPQITKLLTERHIRGLNLDALLTLVVLLYSLVGTDLTFPVRDEVQLQSAISTALYEDQEYPGLVHDILLPLEASKEKVDSIAAHIFFILKAVSHTRRDLTKYKTLLKGQGESVPAEYTPLLQRIIRDIVDPSKPVIPDLSCRSAGLKDLLKSGFSILLNKQQTTVSQHPSEQPNLLFLVLGGITGGEIRFMQEAWAKSPQFKSGGSLLIASTRLMSPNDTLRAVLKSAPQPL
ncbi:sec1 family domain-containing protein 2-like [Thrips palmi]|uniref:Sec1 family domain-containing protein 2-like n=1 Tax=Thrips palmi TaxID=161013 RepID=A0A6P8Y3X5_THRPL|nr:sec1 family domain-containing protein 2-like [Thrips palmi]